MKKCLTCHTVNEDSNKFCLNCGKEIKGLAEIKVPGTSKRVAAKDLPKKKKSKLKISLIVIGSVFCFIVLIIGALLTASYFIDKNEASIKTYGASRVEEALTKAVFGPDQKRVIKLFSYPDQFLIFFDEGDNNKRIDTWIYSEMETSFIFENGAYNSTEPYLTEIVLEDRQEVFPDDFVYAMAPDEIEMLIGKEGIESFNKSTGLKILAFNKEGIICIFNPEDELIIVSKQYKLSGAQ